MKKIVILLLSPLFIMCSSSSIATYQVRNDFKKVSYSEKVAYLKEKKAISEDKSIIILTNGFKGEKIIFLQQNKPIYNSYVITNLKKHYADSFSLNNDSDVTLKDQFLNKEVKITSKKMKLYKFIYIMKEYKNDGVFYKITLSNNLRPI